MTKSLYVMSDTHDDLEAVARAVDFAKSEGRQGSRIVHAGDFALRPYTREALNMLVETEEIDSFLDSKRKHTEQIFRSYKEVLDNSGMPWIAIPGNYDGSLREYFGERDVHGRAVDFDGVKVIGYGGAGDRDGPWIGPEHMEILYDCGHIQKFNAGELTKLLREEKPTIAVIHNPPYGLCDDMFNGNHVGTTVTRRYIESGSNLKLVLSGHIHEAGPNGNNPKGVRGVVMVEKENGNKTFVVNPGNLGRFEILDSKTLEPKRQFDYGTFVRVDIEEDGTPRRLVQYSVMDKSGGKRAIGQVRKIGEFDLS